MYNKQVALKYAIISCSQHLEGSGFAGRPLQLSLEQVQLGSGPDAFGFTAAHEPCAVRANVHAKGNDVWPICLLPNTVMGQSCMLFEGNCFNYSLIWMALLTTAVQQERPSWHAFVSGYPIKWVGHRASGLVSSSGSCLHCPLSSVQTRELSLLPLCWPWFLSPRHLPRQLSAVTTNCSHSSFKAQMPG